MNLAATKQLRDEHEGIKVMLRIMGNVCRKTQESGGLHTAHFSAILEFLKVFVDKCHHAKEEELLFPALEALGIPGEGGPIGVMLHEHAMGRGFIKAMGETFSKYAQGEKSAAAVAEIVHNAQEYIALLFNHIEKENTVLFVMAENMLSATQQEELYAGFERIEEDRIGIGKHEEFHELIHTLRDLYPD